MSEEEIETVFEKSDLEVEFRTRLNNAISRGLLIKGCTANDQRTQRVIREITQKVTNDFIKKYGK